MGTIRSGAVIGGKYRLEGPLGQGGMGAVWAARHLALDTVFAVKFINPGAPDFADAKKRFEREAKAAALLKSPHVVEIHDYGVEGDTPYIVMELLQGEDLASRLARCGRLSVEDTVDIVTQVARALRKAAEANIVHRDLKPGNIFLVHTGDDRELVKVLDFGAAKAPRLATLDDTTKAGMLIGSPRYMSPEQARASRKVDHRSDLWSLAVIAYRALTGRLPFLGEDIGEVIVRVCTEPPPPPSIFVPELGPDMDAFFERALDRDPQKRYQTARELASALADASGIAPMSSRSAPRLSMELLPPPPSHRSDPTPRLGSSRPSDVDPTRPSAPSPIDARALHADKSGTGPVPPAAVLEPEQHSESTPGGTLLNRSHRDDAPSLKLPLLPAPWRSSRGLAGLAAAVVLTAGVILSWRAIRRAPEPQADTPAPSAAPPPVAEAPAATIAPTAVAPAAEPPEDAGAPTKAASDTSAHPAPPPAPTKKPAPGRKHSILGI
jgi:serine/threonine-protein kinase